jgi:ribonuclease-3
MERRLHEATQSAFDDERLLDARSQLQMWAQAEYGETPEYMTISSSGPDHAREFVVKVAIGDHVSATGSGRSKQGAAQQAATQALELLQTSKDEEIH